MIVNSCDMSNLNWSDDEISKFNNAEYLQGTTTMKTFPM
jgi:hypothetical protein